MKLADARKDHYRRLAHEQGFRARSAFKLKELNNNKFEIVYLLGLDSFQFKKKK